MNSIKKATCPACGSIDVERHEKENTAFTTMGPEFSYKQIFYSCKACTEEIDIFGESDENYLAGQKRSQHKFVERAIEWMSTNNISMAFFERVFELPARTLTRWKEGTFSASALSLLHVIVTYPWIVKVAENKFNPSAASYELIMAATNKFLQHTAEVVPDRDIEIDVRSGGIILAKAHYHGQKQRIEPRFAINEFERAS